MTEITSTVTEKIYDKVTEKQAEMAAKSRAKFLHFVMEQENCDLDHARDLCLGRTDPIDYGYTLGWKIEDPLVQQGMWSRTSTKKIKEKFINHFRDGLTPEEDALFVEYYLKDNVGERMYQRKFKKEKKKKETEVEE